MSTFEYVVTLSSRQDLDAFYDDMETSGHSCVEVPEREVQCCDRREISRNTHYMLTEEEAESLKLDSRVRDVVKASDMLVPRLYATQTSYFNRGFEGDSNHTYAFHNTDKNWGLYRHFLDTSTANWGKESGNSNAFPRVNATISWDLEGQDVDIVISDDLIDPDHPEYAVNADGTGGSRVQSIDWADYHNGSVDHWKSTFFDINENHGAAVTSCAAGNTHGLARKANIYNINVIDKPKYAKFEATRSGNVLTVTSVVTGSEPIAVNDQVVSANDPHFSIATISSLGTGTGGVGTYYLSTTPSGDNPITSDYFTVFNGLSTSTYIFDYIRAWHKKKAVNPTTNRRNPTVVNASWGHGFEGLYSQLSSVQYRGNNYNSSNTTWTNDNLYSSFGIVPYPIYYGETDSNASYYVMTLSSTSMEADVEDALEDGIMIVGAAGNDQCKMDVSGGVDYGNTINNSSTFAFHAGNVWSNTDALNVGALDNQLDGGEIKADYSNTGPGVDVYAPGTNCISADVGDLGHGKIVSWSRTNGVVTFNIEGPYFELASMSYVGEFGPYPMRIKVQMDSTTALNGYHDFLEDYQPDPNLNPSGFKINHAGSDVSLTTESGSFYAAQQVSNDILYSYDLSDSRDDTKYLYRASGTSFAAPMTTGLVACWMGYFGRLDRQEFIALINETAASNKMHTGATDDYDDKNALLGGPNKIQRYASFRPSSGFTYPQNTHKARSTATVKGETSYVAFPRQRVLRYGA